MSLPTLIVVLASASAALHAQSPTAGVGLPGSVPSLAPASAGLANDWLRQQNSLFDRFDLGGQFRARFVDDFLLLRTRVHSGYPEKSS
jgi:hypothetical protein